MALRSPHFWNYNIMKNEFDVAKAKQYLKSWQRLQSFSWLGIAFGTPEAKQFKKEKAEDSQFENDNIFEWLIKKALSHL